MLTIDILSRSLSDVTSLEFERICSTRLLHAIQPAPNVCYGGGDETSSAHAGGVNAMAIDRFDGRYLVSGGADGQIAMWDLDSAQPSGNVLSLAPVASVNKSAGGHTFGVTGLSFYPFDSLAFTSSSYDYTLKVFDSVTMVATASFALSSTIYCHAISPIASHLLVACATQHPAIRLADLRTGAATHSLVGHSGGAVLSVAWSPRDSHVLASGGSDGMVRLWDIRRSTGSLGVLDKDDSIGVTGYDGYGTMARRRERGKAHLGPVNGLSWTDDGRHLVTAGHDERIRVWDMATGANTLANFGPAVRNSNLSTIPLALVSQRLVRPNNEVLFYPSESDVLMYELFEGRMIKRLRAARVARPDPARARQRNTLNRVAALCWRPHNVELVSGHSDGTIRTWLPRTSAAALAEQSEEEVLPDEDDAPTGTKRKADPLDLIHEQMARPRPTYI